MNEKTKKFLMDARDKAEDAIVKTKEFIEKHPVACTVGGIVASGLVAGVIGKKIGFKDGYDAMEQNAEDWIHNDQPVDKVYTFMTKENKWYGENDPLAKRNLIRGAMAMHLNEGDSVGVFRTAEGLFIDGCIEPTDETINSAIETFTEV